jgi:chromosome segregation ATPase
MAKNIALTLTLNGVEQTITSVQELEKSIKDARTALGTTFSGTQDELKEFNKQINDAQQSLDTLRNKKGQEESIKSIGNLAKAGSAVTSSFAAATADMLLQMRKMKTWNYKKNL